MPHLLDRLLDRAQVNVAFLGGRPGGTVGPVTRTLDQRRAHPGGDGVALGSASAGMSDVGSEEAAGGTGGVCD